MLRRTAGLAVVLMLVGGITAQAEDPQALFGRTFKSESIHRNGEAHPLFGDSGFRMKFNHEDGRRWVNWNAGCNSYGAKVRIASRRLHLRGIASTEIACPRDERQQEDWLVRFFQDDPTWRLSETERLTLRAGDRAVSLRRK